jgi:Tfp pilus assembly protein PilN
MTQNINFYRRRAPAQHTVSGRGTLTIALVVAAAAVAWYTLDMRRIADMRAQTRQAQAESERVQRLLATVPSPGTEFAQRLKQQEDEVLALESAATRLADGTFSRAVGFTPHLRALSRVAIDGVWLTGIQIDRARGVLALDGRALDAARVPAYLASLQREALFNGLVFAAIEVKAIDTAAQPTLPAGMVQFRLQSAPATQTALAATAGTGTGPQ